MMKKIISIFSFMLFLFVLPTTVLVAQSSDSSPVFILPVFCVSSEAGDAWNYAPIYTSMEDSMQAVMEAGVPGQEVRYNEEHFVFKAVESGTSDRRISYDVKYLPSTDGNGRPGPHKSVEVNIRFTPLRTRNFAQAHRFRPDPNDEFSEEVELLWAVLNAMQPLISVCL
jgi:hypothetical protein